MDYEIVLKKLGEWVQSKAYLRAIGHKKSRIYKTLFFYILLSLNKQSYEMNIFISGYGNFWTKILRRIDSNIREEKAKKLVKGYSVEPYYWKGTSWT